MTSHDKAAHNSKQRMYKAARAVEKEAEAAIKQTAGIVDRVADEANKAVGKSATNSRDRMFKSARAVEDAQKEAMDSIAGHMESIEGKLEEATQEAAKQATGSADEAAGFARQSASDADIAVSSIKEHLAEARSLLDSLRQIHGISTDVAVGGSHDKTAQEERDAANEWRKKSIRYRSLTAVAAVAYTASTVAFPPEGWEWALRSPLGASAVVVLGWMSKYASDQSSEHRIASNIYKHQSLAFASLRHYAQNIAEMAGTETDDYEDDEEVDEADGERRVSTSLLSGEILKSLFTNQIDAFTQQIKATRRSDRLFWRRGTRSDLKP